MDNQYQSQAYEERESHVGRERREEYSYQSAPTSSAAPGSPSAAASASPFAFAPPPLSARPSISVSHSDPSNSYPYYNQRPSMATHNSYPYASSAPMAYRSYSNDSGRPSPQPTGLQRTPSLSIVPPSSVHSQASPSGATTPGVQSVSSPYPYQRQVSGQYASSPQRAPMYPPGYYVPQAADMPRSLSYPSYAQPYPSPQYHMAPMQHSGGLMRHNTTQGLESGVEMGVRPNMGYSFANRLPLVDRPFKCDECVQSFNRNHDLKRHKRIHLAVKPFGCDKCGKTFSRKDALRRHWLVKGCRGEEGATAPIVPMFPINVSRSNVSPPSSAQLSPIDADGMRGYHSGPPPPLTSLPHRDSTESQLIVTPDEAAQQNGMPRSEPMIASGDEHLYDLNSSSHNGSHRGSAGSLNEGYFEGVVGIKHDGTAAMMEPSGTGSPYSKYPNSPSSAHHYRRDTLTSPSRGQASPTTGYMSGPPKNYSPSGLGPDGKPAFAMPFAPANAGYMQNDQLLGPPMEAPRMEKQGSSDSDPTTWQRWHRPSFPFPPPPGVNYNIEPSQMDGPHISSRPTFTI